MALRPTHRPPGLCATPLSGEPARIEPAEGEVWHHHSLPDVSVRVLCVTGEVVRFQDEMSGEEFRCGVAQFRMYWRWRG